MNGVAKAKRAVLRLQINLIDAGDRLRQVDPERVRQIEVSWKDPAVGQIMPIEVRPVAGRFTLISGAHRLAVAISAGDTEIDAFVFEGSDDEVRLREIDENLYRHELTPFDQATFLAERRAIFERRRELVKLEPLDKNKGTTRLAVLRFVNETREKFGLGERTIFLALDRHRRVIPSLWEELRHAPFEKSGADLDRLARLDEEQQRSVERRLFGTVKRRETQALDLRAALSAVMPPAARRGTSEKARRAALQRAWTEAHPADRAHLIETIIKNRDLLDEVLRALGLQDGEA